MKNGSTLISLVTDLKRISEELQGVVFGTDASIVRNRRGRLEATTMKQTRVPAQTVKQAIQRLAHRHGGKRLNEKEADKQFEQVLAKLRNKGQTEISIKDVWPHWVGSKSAVYRRLMKMPERFGVRPLGTGGAKRRHKWALL